MFAFCCAVLSNGFVDLPKGASTVGKTSKKNTSEVPVLQSVLDVLKASNINADGTSLNARDTNVDEWLSKQTSPVFIVHHTGYGPEAAAAPVVSGVKRALDDSDPPLSEFQISQYQIVLWTAVIFFLLLLSAVCSIAQMEVIPDSLLYAKFQSGRTGKME